MDSIRYSLVFAIEQQLGNNKNYNLLYLLDSTRKNQSLKYFFYHSLLINLFTKSNITFGLLVGTVCPALRIKAYFKLPAVFK